MQGIYSARQRDKQPDALPGVQGARQPLTRRLAPPCRAVPAFAPSSLGRAGCSQDPWHKEQSERVLRGWGSCPLPRLVPVRCHPVPTDGTSLSSASRPARSLSLDFRIIHEVTPSTSAADLLYFGCCKQKVQLQGCHFSARWVSSQESTLCTCTTHPLPALCPLGLPRALEVPQCPPARPLAKLHFNLSTCGQGKCTRLSQGCRSRVPRWACTLPLWKWPLHLLLQVPTEQEGWHM